MDDAVEKQTTEDLSFAAYCKLQGTKLLKMTELQRSRRNREFSFTFECTQDDWEQMSTDWLNSPEIRFDMEIKSFKKAFNQMRRRD